MNLIGVTSDAEALAYMDAIAEFERQDSLNAAIGKDAGRIIEVFIGDKFVPTRTVSARPAYDEAAALVANDLSDTYLNRAPEGPGAFLRDGTYYRIQMNRSTGKPYAKVLRDGAFVYDWQAIRNVREIDRLSLDEALAVSAQIGECVVCGRTLTDPSSVAKGIGPVCRKRLAL